MDYTWNIIYNGYIFIIVYNLLGVMTLIRYQWTFINSILYEIYWIKYRKIKISNLINKIKNQNNLKLIGDTNV